MTSTMTTYGIGSLGAALKLVRIGFLGVAIADVCVTRNQLFVPEIE